MEIELSHTELEQLMRPIAGSGGWQSLLRKLQRQVDGQTLALTASDSKKILRYILSYGSGGWQDRMAAVIAAGNRSKSTSRRTAKAARKR